MNNILKNNLFYTILNIRSAINESKIYGVHVLLIDLIDIPEKMRMCCDLSLKNKLFSFVVKDEPTATKLLEVNKQQKGSSFSMFPLEW